MGESCISVTNLARENYSEMVNQQVATPTYPLFGIKVAHHLISLIFVP